MCANTIPASKHNNLDKRSSVSEQDYKRITCAQCKTEFNSKRKKKYCSASCRDIVRRRKEGALPRAESDARRRLPANCFVCEHCGIDAHRRRSGTNKGPNRFCSMACRVASAAAKRADASAEADRYRLLVKPEVDALRRIAKKGAIKTQLFRFSCVHCESPMIVRRNGGLHKMVCGSCIKAAAAKHKKEARRKQRRDGRRCDSSRKKARKYGGIYDPSVSWLKVFERDKWRCHICGIRTPKSKRGTFDHDAPELDHVVPLALGGSHTWDNVRCSCRRCNGSKGATVIGQLGLGLLVA